MLLVRSDVDGGVMALASQLEGERICCVCSDDEVFLDFASFSDAASVEKTMKEKMQGIALQYSDREV